MARPELDSVAKAPDPLDAIDDAERAPVDVVPSVVEPWNCAEPVTISAESVEVEATPMVLKLAACDTFKVPRRMVALVTLRLDAKVAPDVKLPNEEAPLTVNVFNVLLLAT